MIALPRNTIIIGDARERLRRSIEARVQASQSDPELIARAEAVRVQIEREAEARKEAIASLFGSVALGSEGAAPRSGRRGGRGQG
jgi:hypothetical protein